LQRGKGERNESERNAERVTGKKRDVREREVFSPPFESFQPCVLTLNTALKAQE